MNATTAFAGILVLPENFAVTSKVAFGLVSTALVSADILDTIGVIDFSKSTLLERNELYALEGISGASTLTLVFDGVTVGAFEGVILPVALTIGASYGVTRAVDHLVVKNIFGKSVSDNISEFLCEQSFSCNNSVRRVQ